MRPRSRPALRHICCLIVLSLLFVTSVNAQAKKNRAQANKDRRAAASSPSCTSRTGLYCEMYGSGPPMLFIHGLGGSSYSWRFMKDPFKQNYQVILIDLLGEGKSPKPNDGNYSIIEQGELIYQFIVEKNLRNLTLVGNSYGGAVSLLLSMRLVKERPSRLSKLVLIDSGGYPDHLPDYLKLLQTPGLGWLAVHLIPPKLQIYIVLHKSYYDPCKITRKQISTYAKPIRERGGRHALLELAKGAIPAGICGYIEDYKTIKVPTLILWGDDDQVLPELIGCRLKYAIPYSTMEIINNAGHMPQEEEPDQVICHIQKFLGVSVTCPTSRPPTCGIETNPCSPH